MAFTSSKLSLLLAVNALVKVTHAQLFTNSSTAFTTISSSSSSSDPVVVPSSSSSSSSALDVGSLIIVGLNPSAVVIDSTSTITAGGSEYTDASNTVSLDSTDVVVNGTTIAATPSSGVVISIPASTLVTATTSSSSSSSSGDSSSSSSSSPSSDGSGTSTSDSSSSSATPTSTMTTEPPNLSTAYWSSSITGNEWLTTTGSDSSTTVVPIILPCLDCKPIIGWNFPPIPNVVFSWPDLPELPKFHFPCIGSGCNSPPVNDGPPESSNTEDPQSSIQSSSASSSNSESSRSESSESSTCSSASTVSNCQIDCEVYTVTDDSSSSLTTTCPTTSCSSTATGCSVTGTTTTLETTWPII